MIERCSWKNCISILVLYFIGFLYVIPFLVKKITLILNPDAYIMNLPILTVAYVLIVVTTVYLTKNVWLNGIANFKKGWKEHLTLIFYVSILMLALNLVLSFLFMILTKHSGSVNQGIIQENAIVAPLYTIFTGCILAPILEETVFRAGLFSCLRKKHSFLCSASISSIAFGSIHILESLFSGNVTDLLYLVLYSMIGMFLAYVYEKTNSVCSSVFLHLLNNIVSTLTMFLL